MTEWAPDLRVVKLARLLRREPIAQCELAKLLRVPTDTIHEIESRLDFSITWGDRDLVEAFQVAAKENPALQPYAEALRKGFEALGGRSSARARRVTRGYTQQEAADHFKVSVKTISRWESAGKVFTLPHKVDPALEIPIELSSRASGEDAPSIDVLRAARARLDLTQAGLAKKLKVSLSLIRAWEYGNAPITIQNAQKFVRLFQRTAQAVPSPKVQS